jgi:hypothetical protein
MMSNCGPLGAFPWLPAPGELLMPVKAASLNDLDEPPKFDDEDDDEENAMFVASYCGLGVICTRDRFAR